MRHTRKSPAAALAVLAALAVGGVLSPPAAADTPIPLARTGQVTDQVDALQDRAGEVRLALDRLYDQHRVQLFTVYVNGFSGASPQDWADATAERNGLGRKDVLLAVATRDRQYAVSADQQSGLSQQQIDEVNDRAIEPALRQNDWAGAAVGAANGYDAVLGGDPVAAPVITPGAADPGGAHSRSTGSVWIPVVALGAALLLGIWAYRRRAAQQRPVRTSAGQGAEQWRARPKQPVPVTPLPELDAQARELLVATDDAVRTSEEDVGFAAAQFGDDAARPFGEAVEYAKDELTAAFRLRQKLDDAYPEDDETRRQMLGEILSRCTQANRRLDAESEAFDRLRAMEANAPQVLARAEEAAVALPARIDAAAAALGPLAERYADSALEPVAGHPDEARDRLGFARTSLEQAQEAIGTDHGRAAVFVRAAEGALDQAAVLADSVIRREQELRAADTKLAEALAEAEADLAEARAVLGGPGAGGANGAGGAGDAGGLAHAELRGRVARVESVLAAVRGELAQGRPDPIAALRRVEEADAALDGALAGAREEEAGQRRTAGLLEQALLAARSEVAAARDTVTTHRGAIGSRARTRLTEAERRLHRAEALAADDPRQALEHAREADRLAREAQAYAQDDVSGFGGRRGRGGAGGGMGGMAGVGGAVLGGILLGDLLGGGRSRGAGMGGYGGYSGYGSGRGGGAGPGSFGGGGTRGRMGGGGRF
ncbi:TPM domain-containing protein [Streptomyces sp. CA2R106]|uniref:TPM domain-containing protein n=1 Tax=Streptomyces sp. CA2R106 TaxID=3120153 RepID=UPI00300BEABE